MINIEELRTLCNNKAIKWTTHVSIRLQERNINPSDFKNCILTGEIIEQYPHDYPYPSCLVLGFSVNNEYLHAVAGVGNGILFVISAYFPTLDKWEDDYKTRKVLR